MATKRRKSRKMRKKSRRYKKGGTIQIPYKYQGYGNEYSFNILDENELRTKTSVELDHIYDEAGIIASKDNRSTYDITEKNRNTLVNYQELVKSIIHELAETKHFRRLNGKQLNNPEPENEPKRGFITKWLNRFTRKP